ncbi:glycosyltransferase [Phyllobacterium sp. SYP-B3895]|uniref:glycosyltransferase n=1 Tax=Phyllobacterium sp. SYP-B3895 TaxID=2663240 RepID=UPI0012999772|nr:glycosyltransferase [Phyllobacterium sp. SYP-B3895]MRG53981.1 glycosyltransferase [Phyllobacterium sp. SYP-B3895]
MLVSVIIPSYNHARYVKQAIRSVIEQSYSDVELIIIDDGSSDGSEELIRESISENCGRHIVFEAQRNAGAHQAIMRGLSLAKGNLLTILNSDDFYELNRLERMLHNFSPVENYIAFSRVRLVDDRSCPLSNNAPLQLWYDQALRDAARCPTVGYALLRNNISVTSGNLLFTRALYDRVGGFRHFKMCHDWDFLMRATHYVEPIYIQEPLMAYRYHETNTLRSTAHLVEQEGAAALNDFVKLGLSETAPNHLAPGWAHWPAYFDLFIDRFACWFSKEPMGRFIQGRPVQKQVRGRAIWVDNARLGLADTDFLTSSGAGNEAYALLREMLLGQSEQPVVSAELTPAPKTLGASLKRILGRGNVGPISKT